MAPAPIRTTEADIIDRALAAIFPLPPNPDPAGVEAVLRQYAAELDAVEATRAALGARGD